MDAVARRAGVIGLAGLAGLAWSGMGAVDVLRGSLDRMFDVEKLGGVKGKVRNLRFMLVTGGLLALSIAAASLAGDGVQTLLQGTGVKIVGGAIALAFTLAANVALFAVVFVLLPDHGYGWRDVRSGALLAAVGWTMLKTIGGGFLGAAAARSSAAYGVAAAVFGLLLAINLASRLTLFAAEWAATGIRLREPPVPSDARVLERAR
jgi:membrane protein